MEERGLIAPETETEASDRYRELGAAAQTVTRETAKAMAFDREEYAERVTGDVVETARDALFASLLTVSVGTYEEFESFREANPDLDVRENGSAQVDNAVWHVVPFADTVVAATFQNEPEAAVATLRRIVHGRYYSGVV
ncbi:hypothetical protein MBEHAL_0081 [Halarchaeum acidiphilum MH1-52-1]|uniref:Uncharacterized protein n=1 Tax=Halarchaeum acidiphilum MH1-52-1 TaxID=1261545 RepID=U2YCL5_9EURY|nr:DUF5809 family protein [Halarchaeum acidiphilum]GAD51321.1 hypothetical protein MBEHAL_0081 [Halarchaeum acidiphilum MH1-52-1]